MEAIYLEISFVSSRGCLIVKKCVNQVNHMSLKSNKLLKIISRTNIIEAIYLEINLVCPWRCLIVKKV